MSENKTKAPPPALSNSEALTALQQQSMALLTLKFEIFLETLAEHLFPKSPHIQSDSTGYNAHHEAAIGIRRNKGAISNALKSELAQHYEDVTQQDDIPYSESQHAHSAHKLGLISIDEFDTHLALNKMIKAHTQKYHIPLECLTIRLAKLLDLDPNIVNLPVHVGKIARAFPKSLKGKEIPTQAIAVILEQFDTEFLNKLDDYYESLNLPLRNAGIGPDLEKEVKAKGTLLKLKIMKEPERLKHRARQQQDILLAQGQAGGNVQARRKLQTTSNSQRRRAPSTDSFSGHFSADALYNSVISALNFKREADALLSGAEPAHNNAPENLADVPSVAEALGALQQDSAARGALLETASLRDYLTTNRESIGELSGTQGLSQDSINQLDLVDKLFGTIKSQVDVTTELKPTLGNLQIPLAKLALLEPHFFVDRDHPARGVVDKLAQLASSANFPNKALESRIGRIVDNIITDYDDDSIVFETALTKVDKLLTQQQRALERNRERVVKTQEGQQKLKRAHAAAAAVINTRITPPEAPNVLVQLVESGLRDMLVLTHLREGIDSSTWKEHVKTLDLLSFWLNEQQTESVGDDVLMERSLEAEPLIDMISQQISAALPTSIAHEPVLNNLRKILDGQQDIVMTPVALPEEAVDPQAKGKISKIRSLPRINRWVKRVHQLKNGTWLNYKDKEGQKRRMQLAWISDSKDRFIFVNELGQRHADISAVQLARQLSRGVKPLTVADKLSLVDQSMYDTLEHVQKSLSFARNHDALTKLINYETFLQQAGRALRHAERKHSQHAVLYLNIDQFDLVNQVFDETNGDLVLFEFAKLLAQLHGKKTSSTRIGGDEFGILLLDQTIEQAVQHAEQIRTDIESSSVEIEDEDVTFTVSIGVAPIRNYSPSIDKVIEFSRSAMRLAKDKGGNQVVEYEEQQSDIDHYKSSQLEAKSQVQHTLETNRFVLRAQPIVQASVDIAIADAQHFEILLGLTNTDGTLSSPVEFIKSAERYGYMELVDRWVVTETFTWVSQLMDSQKIVPNLSINLSGGSITSDSFMDFLFEQISEFGVGTSKICFEITETGTISNLVKAADFVQAFRNIGCKFSIDDFGTGLASHNYLRELPVDYVKIDGIFIKEIDSSRNDYAMTRSINDLAHFLGQKTIAESVENERIIEKLIEIGVDYLQGWGVGMPKLLTELAADLDSIEK